MAFDFKRLKTVLKSVVDPVSDIAELGVRHVVAATKKLTEAELTVDECCSLEAWGPHGATLNKLAEYTHKGGSKYTDVVNHMWKKLNEKDENWRMCYKALLLLEYLVKSGPEAIVTDTLRDENMKFLKNLADKFQYKDPKGYDQGANVRHRAKLLLQLLQSPEQLSIERKRAAESKGRYEGLSSDQFAPPPGAEPEVQNNDLSAPPDPAAFDVEFPAFETEFPEPEENKFEFSLPTTEDEPVTWNAPPELTPNKAQPKKKLNVMEALEASKGGAAGGMGLGLAPPPPGAGGVRKN